MKERARAVVIGGGVGGCAILYWLSRLGWSDIVLVERADLTSGAAPVSYTHLTLPTICSV